MLKRSGFLWFALLLLAGCRTSEFQALEKSARKGDAQAQYELGKSYRRGDGVETNLTEAVKWYRASAEQGNAKAQHALGLRYEKGDGVELSWDAAARWYRKAADQGYASAQCNLGYCTEKGYGVEANLPEAVRLYHLSAIQSNKVAQANLGYCYLKGRGVEKDIDRSVEWYRKSAEQGYARAQYSLGLRYLNGEGVEKDPVVAVEWIRKAAGQDYPSAVRSMVYKYEKGIGVEADMDEANRWYEKALTLGYTRDLKKVESLKDYGAIFAENDKRLRGLNADDSAAMDYVEWMKTAIDCKNKLKLPAEIDPWLEDLSSAFSNDWKILHAVAMGYDDAADVRGYDRAIDLDGDTDERNRRLALGLMDRAYRLMMQKPPTDAQQAVLIRDYLMLLIEERMDEAHLLQKKTIDCSVEEVMDYRFGLKLERKLIFYDCPATYESAASDGELVHWLLGRYDIKVEDVLIPKELQRPGYSAALAMVQSWKPRKLDEESIEVMSGLADDEVLWWNEGKPEAIKLPDGHVFIPVIQKLAEQGDEVAAVVMAGLCQGRFQLERAAHYFGLANDTNMVRSIRANQGAFSDCPAQPAGTSPQVNYQYRNGEEVEVSVFRIHAGTNFFQRLENGEVMHSEFNLLRGYPAWFRKTGLFDESGVLELVTQQTLPLEPPADHRDASEKIVFQPLEAGNYLVRAQMKDGNEAETVLNICDAMVYSASLPGTSTTNLQSMFLLCDALTGRPLPDEAIHFLDLSGGLKRDENRKTHDGPYTVDQKVDGRTDDHGIYVLDAATLNNPDKDLYVLARADSRHPLITESDKYHRRNYGWHHAAQYPFIATDRPVYRPGDVGHFKLWTAGETNASVFEIVQPRSQGRLTLESSSLLTPDQYGGAHLDFSIPADAPLGNYSINEMVGEKGQERGSLRVEQYRTPEFEVSAKWLDDGKIEVRADYTYGQPVAGGKLSLSVNFLQAEARSWYPKATYDALWGTGYWWHGNQYNSDEPESQRDRFRFSENLETVLDGEGRFVFDPSKYEDGEKALSASGRFWVKANVTDAANKKYDVQEQLANDLKERQICCWLDKAFFEPEEEIVCQVGGEDAAGETAINLYRVEGTNSIAAFSRSASAGQVKLGRLEPGMYEVTAAPADGEVSEPFRFFVVGAVTGLTKENPVRVVREKGVCHAGETASVLVQVDQPGRYVYFFDRVTRRDAFSYPTVIFMDTVSKRIELPFSREDAGQLQCAAMTVVDGEMHIQGCTVPVVEDSKESGTVELKTDKVLYHPGETVALDLRTLDASGKGKPCAVAVTVYNKVLDSFAGSGGRNNIYSALYSPWQYNVMSNLRLYDGWPSTVSDEAPDWVMERLGYERNFTVHAKSFGGGTDDLFGDSGRNMNFYAASPAPAARLRKRVVAKSAGVGRVALEDAIGTEAAPLTIREDFRDAVYWNALVETDGEGRASVEFPVPDGLTEWKIVAWAMHTNYAASGETSIRCAKDFVLQLNTPRFMVEGDELEVSASLRNHTTNMLSATALCSADGGVVQVYPAGRKNIQSLEAGQEQMLYWNLQAVADGKAVITAEARSKEASDGVAKPLPVLPHAMLKRGGRSGVLAGERREEIVLIDVPQAIDPDSLKLELNCTANMLESVAAALPYLADYPYGCTEQTLNRFLPSLVVLQTLEKTGLNLNGLTASLPADRKAVYDRAEIIKRAQAGINKLQEARGWNGWWSWNLDWNYGRQDPLVSAWALRGMHAASAVPGLTVDQADNIRSLNEMVERMELLLKPDWRQRKSERLTNADAMLALVVQEVFADIDLSKSNRTRVAPVLPQFSQYLLKHAHELSLYGKVLLAYTFELQNNAVRRDELIQFIEQYLETDPELGTCWLRTEPEGGWRWYNDAVEIQAWYLKLLNRIEPDSAKAAGVARYLLINREHGDHWKSTRDTAICIEALCGFVEKHPPSPGQTGYEVLLNGTPVSDGLRSGRNKLVLKANGDHPLFYDAVWQYHTRENPIAAEKCDLVSVSRTFHRIDPETGKAMDEPLTAETKLRAGETIEVRLEIDAAQELEYVLAQDFKPAGFECLKTESGYRYGKLWHYEEIHSERVSFYIEKLPAGCSEITYRLRPEQAGKIAAMPATVELMYAPRQAANSAERKLQVER